jgi:hypothetical protein
MRARDNPFRSERLLAVRYRLQGITWNELLSRCEALRYRAALVGPYGSGKTTLLEDLQPHLRAQGFEPRLIRLNCEGPVLIMDIVRLAAQADQKMILLVDGTEQLGALAWYWFKWATRNAGGLIITRHTPGRLPTLHQCCTSVDLLEDIIDELLADSMPDLRDRAEALFHKHQGNLREALRDCYDLLSGPTGDFCADSLRESVTVSL